MDTFLSKCCWRFRSEGFQNGRFQRLLPLWMLHGVLFLFRKFGWAISRLPPLPVCIFSHPPTLGASAASSLYVTYPLEEFKESWIFDLTPLPWRLREGGKYLKRGCTPLIKAHPNVKVIRTWHASGLVLGKKIRGVKKPLFLFNLM